MTYIYLGDRNTDPSLKRKPCTAVRNEKGKCIRDKNGNMSIQWEDGDFEADCVTDQIRVLISKNDKGYFVANAMDGYGNNTRDKYTNAKVTLLTPIT